jgi:Zn-dependent protease with chaperone function
LRIKITQTQRATRLRSWTLVAGLTGLLIALGMLLGGAFTWLFAGIAVAANLVGYFYSDRIAIRAARAELLPEARAPEVHQVVLELSARAQIPMPRLYVMPGEQANAFATGRDPAHAAVAMTEGLLTNVSVRQVRGVLAHELCHIRNHDILVSSLAAMIAGAISAIVNVLQLSFLFGGQEGDGPLSSSVRWPRCCWRRSGRCSCSWVFPASASTWRTPPPPSFSVAARRWPTRSRTLRGTAHNSTSTR